MAVILKFQYYKNTCLDSKTNSTDDIQPNTCSKGWDVFSYAAVFTLPGHTRPSQKSGGWFHREPAESSAPSPHGTGLSGHSPSNIPKQQGGFSMEGVHPTQPLPQQNTVHVNVQQKSCVQCCALQITCFLRALHLRTETFETFFAVLALLNIVRRPAAASQTLCWAAVFLDGLW